MYNDRMGQQASAANNATSAAANNMMGQAQNNAHSPMTQGNPMPSMGQNQTAAAGMHPLVAALIAHHLGNMNGTPQQSPGVHLPAGIGGGMIAPQGLGNAMNVAPGGLPAPNLGPMAGATQPLGNMMRGAPNQQQLAQGNRGAAGGFAGMPMGMYGSFYGGQMPQGGMASQMGGGLMNTAARNGNDSSDT